MLALYVYTKSVRSGVRGGRRSPALQNETAEEQYDRSNVSKQPAEAGCLNGRHTATKKVIETCNLIVPHSPSTGDEVVGVGCADPDRSPGQSAIQ